MSAEEGEGGALSRSSPTAPSTPQQPSSSAPPFGPTAAVAHTAAQRDLEAPSRRQSLAERSPGHLGMHVVLRVALVDVVSHPDSGSVHVSLRSRLLGRPIARAPLALGLAWRF